MVMGKIIYLIIYHAYLSQTMPICLSGKVDEVKIN